MLRLKYIASVAVTGIFLTSCQSPIESSDRNNYSVHHVNDERGSGNFWIKSDDINLRAEWMGSYAFTDPGNNIETIYGRLEIQKTSGQDSFKVVFQGRGRNFETNYSINNQTQSLDETAQASIENMVRLFVLESGIEAESRVAALFERGGINRVFAEIDEISTSHAARKYLVALTKTAPLTETAITEYATRVQTINGDHDKRKAIGAVFENQNSLSPQSRTALLTAAAGIESDHEIRKLMEVAASGELTADSTETALTLLERISSDHEMRKSAEILLNNQSFLNNAAVDLLELCGEQINSDHELRKVIERSAFRAETAPLVAQAAIRTATQIRSDHEKRRALEALAAILQQESTTDWMSLLEVANSIASDHEKRKALATIANKMPDEQALMDQYRTIAASISSKGEREKALARVR